MKLPFITLTLVAITIGCGNNEPAIRLFSDQKRLKDSANNVNQHIGLLIQRGAVDSAATEIQKLEKLRARLTEIQRSIDERLGKGPADTP